MNMHVTMPSDPEQASANTGQLPIPKATVEDIVAKRNVALAKYREAHQRLVDAQAALTSASEARQFTKGAESRYNYHLGDRDRDAIILSLKVDPADVYMKRCRQIVDTDCWSHVIEITQLERLMDRQAKDEFTKSLQDDPPEVTVDNIYATLETLIGQAGFLMRRGVANAFASLDRRFRSHDGFKVGSRIILDRAFSDYGSWNYNRNQRDALMDVERALLMIDGKTVPPNYAGVVGALEAERNQHRGGARQSQHEIGYFGFRCYMNGNLHIWFRDKDLLRKVNRLLAEYYGEVVADGQTKEADPLNNPKTTPAKRFGLFPTPDELADRVTGMAALLRSKDEPRLRVLEPSAGTGQLARRCVDRAVDRKSVSYHGRDSYHFTTVVDCVEVQPALAANLSQSRLYNSVRCMDFLNLQPSAIYDRVVMNPPFDLERDIDHVMHALKFLNPNGLLVAIMSAGTEFRETRKSVAFRAHIEKLGGVFTDLPANSFSSVGTNVNTVLLRVSLDGRRWWY